MQIAYRWSSRFWVMGLLLSVGAGCTTPYRKQTGVDAQRVFSKIYLTDFETTWQSVMDALKHSRMDVVNKESGFLQTRWTENTSEKNFADSIGATPPYLKAQYRFRVTVSKGFFDGRPSVRVAVFREQVVQRDALEGWAPIESDTIEENTLLYRIGRLIWIKHKLAKMEEDRLKKELENVSF